MRRADFCTLLDRCPADIAFFSTYAFQPTYFERCLLNSRALANARRIVVLVDGSQYRKIQKDGEPTWHLNHRYLLVPVFPNTGVFHPKLHLLVSAKGALVFCGSGNLTQPGCTHNIEMLNSVQVEIEEGKKPSPGVGLAQQALAFFDAALGNGTDRASALAREWLVELKASYPWLEAKERQSKIDGNLQLHHNLDGALWAAVQNRIGVEKVKRVTALSPFYDRELAVLKTMRLAWPSCGFRIVAQQHSSNLPTKVLQGIVLRPELFALTGCQERRLHAKMIVIETSARTVVVAGSANFTHAAWMGANVEACFIWDTKGSVDELLFGDELKLVSITPEDFIPGTEEPPTPDEQTEGGRLFLYEAVFGSDGKISVNYGMDENLLNCDITLRLYPAGRLDPLPPQMIPAQKRGNVTVTLGEGDCSEMRHAVACELSAVAAGTRVTSPRTWLVQENALTHAPGEGDQRTKTEHEVVESGRGLSHHLAQIEREDGLEGLARWLRDHTIQFSEQQRDHFGRLRGLPRKHDPFRTDDPQQEEIAPQSAADLKLIQAAVQEFAERHRTLRLERHVRNGNIYGLRNFMDIFIAVNSRVFEYYARGLVHPLKAVGLIVDNLKVALRWERWRDENGDDQEKIGFLHLLARNYAADLDLLRARLQEANVPGHLYVSLLMAQLARVKCDKGNAKPESFLETYRQRVESVLHTLGLPPPTAEEKRRALREYEFNLEVTEESVLVEIPVVVPLDA